MQQPPAHVPDSLRFLEYQWAPATGMTLFLNMGGIPPTMNAFFHRDRMDNSPVETDYHGVAMYHM